MGTNADLYWLLRDLMDIYQLDFKKCTDCILEFRFVVPEYERYKKYDVKFRKEKLDEVIKVWQRNIRFFELEKYNDLTKRISTGFDVLDHTEDEAKYNRYRDSLTILLKHHQVYVENLGIRHSTKPVKLPYILQELKGRPE